MKLSKRLKKTYPLHSYAALQIIEINNWRPALKISLKFVLRRQLKTPLLIRKVSRRIVFKIATWMPRKKKSSYFGYGAWHKFRGKFVSDL